MKRITTAALAALALAAAIPTTAKADDPVSPVKGAVCNLYLLEAVESDTKKSAEITAILADMPAAATFVDSASEFKAKQKKEGIMSNWGMWTGWLKQETAGTYTFTCSMLQEYHRNTYSVWVNGQKCLANVPGQNSFNVNLSAGFNTIKIVVHNDYGPSSLSITYKKAGSVKDPFSFGPESMYYDDEE